MWLNDVLNYSGIFLVLVLPVFLMVPVASAITSFFLDDVAQAVEDESYPGLPVPPPVTFKEVLGIGSLPSVEDCFFTTLGGDSFTAAQVVQRLREEFCYEVAIREIYSSPRVAQLAALVDTKSSHFQVPTNNQ